MTLFDSHTHLTCETLYPECDTLALRAQEAGIVKMVNVNTDALSFERGQSLSKTHPWISQAFAIHPHDASEGESLFPLVEEAARKGSLAAIGETGLDYFYTHSSKDKQHEFLRRHLRLAKETKLPVVIHCREAFSDFFKILDEETKSCAIEGVLHCFTGTLDEAKEVIRRGFYLSLSGIVTFKKSTALQEVAAYAPSDRLLIETDAPYLAPQSRRGKTNEPAYLKETALYVAKLRSVSFEHLANQTYENACRLFHLST